MMDPVRIFLIVGLGNPGKEHRSNRHNIGFMLLDILAEEYGCAFTRRKSKSLVSDVMLDVTVELGRQSLRLSQVLNLNIGSVVELDRSAGAPVDIRVNGILFGRGEVVVVDNEYAVRVIEILEQPSR